PLEVVLQSKQQRPASGLEGRLARSLRVGVGLRETDHRNVARRGGAGSHQQIALILAVLGERIVVSEIELLVRQSSQTELRQRVIQPVRRRETELNLLPLGDVEVLVDCQIAVEVRRTVQVREVQRALLALNLWRSEAVGVEVRA